MTQPHTALRRASIALVFAIGSATHGHAQEAVWEALPLPGICRATPRAPHPPALTNGRHLVLEPSRGFDAEAQGAELPVPQLVSMLERDTRTRGIGVEVYRGAPPLLARGKADAVAELRRQLADLERASETLWIDLRVSLTPLQTPERQRVFEKRVRAGDATQFGERASQAFVAGWNVEVAVDSGVAAPAIGHALTGETLHLTAQRVESGRAVHVDGWLDLAELVAVEDFDPGTNDLGLIQQPTVRSIQVAFSGRVAPGEALEVELRDTPLSSPDWTLAIEATTSPDVTDASGWAMLDLGFVSTPAPSLPAAQPGVGVDDWLSLENDASAFEPLTPSAVAGAVDLARATTDGASRAPLHWTSTLLFLPADDEFSIREARAFVDAAERARLKTTLVEVRQDLMTVTLPTTSGRPARVRLGQERTWLVDYGVEIAPETWMAEPVTEAAFDGMCLDLATDDSGAIGTAWIASSAAPGVLNPDNVLLGRLQLPARSFRGDGVRLGPGQVKATLLSTEGNAGVTLNLTPK